MRRTIEKRDHSSRVEVKHLRTSEPSIADLVKGEDRGIEALAGKTEPALAIAHDHL